jgi:hypothetical protein
MLANQPGPVLCMISGLMFSTSKMSDIDPLLRIDPDIRNPSPSARDPLFPLYFMGSILTRPQSRNNESLGDYTGWMKDVYGESEITDVYLNPASEVLSFYATPRENGKIVGVPTKLSFMGTKMIGSWWKGHFETPPSTHAHNPRGDGECWCDVSVHPLVDISRTLERIRQEHSNSGNAGKVVTLRPRI